MPWFLQDRNELTVAGPFEYLSRATVWALEHPGRGILTATQIDEPLDPIIVSKMTPALQYLQSVGEVILVTLPFGFWAVYVV